MSAQQPAPACPLCDSRESQSILESHDALVTGERFRIRLDLTPDGFILSTNPFEGDCGEYGCAHYPFVRVDAP